MITRLTLIAGHAFVCGRDTDPPPVSRRTVVSILLAAGVLALLLDSAALADITTGGAKAQSIFNSWARPIAACMIVAGAIAAFAKKNLIAIVTFITLVLALGGFVINPNRGLSMSDTLLGRILG